MKFSLLCAVRDEEQHIAEMLDSVRAQTYPHWEILVVDDRSTDWTPEIIREYAARDHRIVAVLDAGVSGKNSAFNAAYRASDGDVLLYQGGDDVLPPDALAARVDALRGVDPAEARIALFSKVRMFSDDPRFDGVVVPRGTGGSRSGGTTAMTRAMANEVFPLDVTLPNEDLWTSTLVELFSERTIDLPAVTLNYRIHAGNSFRRNQTFEEATEAYHERGLVYERLLESRSGSLSPQAVAALRRRAQLEDWRYRGQLRRLLLAGSVPLRHRLRLASQASPSLYSIRQRFYGTFSGW
jgi:glycosyltransferase involved in cell wall biosynthesis